MRYWINLVVNVTSMLNAYEYAFYIFTFETIRDV